MSDVDTARAVAPEANGRLACEGQRPDADGVMGSQVYTINPDGTGERVLTDLPTRDGDPSWSPDSTKIAFGSFRDDGSEVYVMNADGTGVTRLTFNGPPEDPARTGRPDGTEIAFHSRRTGMLDIFVMDADGSNVRQITNSPDTHEFSPCGRRRRGTTATGDGWCRFNSSDNERFRNQGQCVRWFSESRRDGL